MKLIYISLLILLIVYIYIQVNQTVVNYVSIKSSKIKKDQNIKILQITDFHNKKYNSEKIIKLITKLDFDLITITGDFVDKHTKNLKNVDIFIDKLLEVNSNIFFVYGNHEHKNKSKNVFIEMLKEKKVHILKNTNEIFRKQDNLINICGIDSTYLNSNDITETFKNIDINNFTILLSHSPNVILEQEKITADLILCGHTHGGQIRFPLIGPVVGPSGENVLEYDRGLFKINKKTLLYVDSGIGTSTIPIRFLNRSQVSLISIENY